MVNPSAATTTQPVAALAAIDLRPSELPYRAQETGENGDGTSGRHTALVRPAGRGVGRGPADRQRATGRDGLRRRRASSACSSTRIRSGRAAPRDWDNPGARDVLPEVRRLIAAGEYAAADALPSQMQGPYNQSYQPLGDLHRTFCTTRRPAATAASWTCARRSPRAIQAASGRHFQA